MLIPYLEEIILNTGESLPRRKLALKIAADAGGISILDSVIKVARDPNVSLRFSAIKTLNYFRKYGTLSETHPSLLPIIYREIAVLESELKKASMLNLQDGRLIANLFKQRISWTYERVFRALALIFPHDEVYHAYLGWISSDQRKRDAAIEFVEQALNAELRERLLPLLEFVPPETSEEDTQKNRAQAFRNLLEEGDPLYISAAILDLDDSEWEAWKLELQTYLDEKQSELIRETIERRSAMSQQSDKRTFTMIEKMENLSRVDLFSRLSPAELLLLGEVATEAEYQTGEIIYQEGDAAQEIFSLIEGRVELYKLSELINVVNPGESFGTLGVLKNQNRMSTAIATEAARCLKIQSETFWEILEDYTPVCHGVIEVLVNRIETLTTRLAGSERDSAPA
jgi:CRP-like cAMP-binding protein